MAALPLSMWKDHTTESPSGSRSPRGEVTQKIKVYSPLPKNIETHTEDPSANGEKRIVNN